MKHAAGIVLALSLALAVFGPAAAQQEGLIPATVRSSVSAAVDQGERVGVVLGYTRNGEHDFYAFGEMAAGQGGSLSADTIFEIGSVTKLFTAETLAALSLTEDVSLRTKLSEIWPGRLAGSPITLAELATHTAGLQRRIPDEALAQNSEAALLASVGDAGETGNAPSYSNTGMALLARALAVRTGNPPADNVLRLVSTPMGLHDTDYEPVDRPRLAHPHLGRVDISDTRMETVEIARGAGGLYSTPRDLLRFVEEHLAPSNPEVARLVEVSLDGAEGVPLGWQVHDDGLRRIFHHTGEANGYQVFVGFRQDTQSGVVLMANSSVEDELQWIALHLLDPAAPLPVFEVRDEAAMLGEFAGHTGEYVVEGDDSGNAIIIREDAGGLVYVETGPDGAPVRQAPLVEVETGVFQIRGAPIFLEFEPGEAGTVRLRAGGSEYRLLRQE